MRAEAPICATVRHQPGTVIRSHGGDGRARTAPSLLLYKINAGQFHDRNWPVSWVGVAGFEPAASSSRSQVAARTASSAACLTWERSSVSVRCRPLLAMVIGTHLVIRLLAGRWRELSLKHTRMRVE